MRGRAGVTGVPSPGHASKGAVQEPTSIQREIWNGEEGAPKTEAHEAGVFAVPLLGDPEELQEGISGW